MPAEPQRSEHVPDRRTGSQARGLATGTMEISMAKKRPQRPDRLETLQKLIKIATMVAVLIGAIRRAI
jgi:hypothetical protein